MSKQRASHWLPSMSCRESVSTLFNIRKHEGRGYTSTPRHSMYESECIMKMFSIDTACKSDDIRYSDRTINRAARGSISKGKAISGCSNHSRSWSCFVHLQNNSSGTLCDHTQGRGRIPSGHTGHHWNRLDQQLFSVYWRPHE